VVSGPAIPLRGKRLLVTGASGQIASAVCKRLAAANQVWGAARFADEERRRELGAAGVRTCPVNLADGDLSALPDDIDHLLHLAVYMPAPPTGVSKVAQEAVAKFCAREFGLPVVIARMNVAYGAGGGVPARHLGLLLAGETIVLRHDPAPYSPIHEDDIVGHLRPLLAAAAVPALVVNFGGDEVVTTQQWCGYLADLAGVQPRFQVTPLPGGQPGGAVDVTRRQSLTGPDRVSWRDGMPRMFEARLPLGGSRRASRL